MDNPSITVFKGDDSRLNSTIDISSRITSSYYAQEVDKVFRKSWLLVGSTLDLPQKGSFITTEVPPLNASLLVVRGSDDQVRVFHNVCRHRGEKVETCPEGKSRAFTCRFHAWTYSTTGSLVGITDATQFCNIDKENLGLIPVNTEVWEGLIFVNFEQKPEKTLKEWLGVIYDQYADFSQGRVKISDHRVVLKTNWNLAINAFSEGYHNLYLHKNTVPDYQGGTANPNRHRAYIEVGPKFGRYSSHGNPQHKPTRVEEILYRHSRPMFPSFSAFDMDALPPGVNATRFSQWGFDIVHLVPNIIMGTQANTHSLMWFWPIDHEHTDIRVARYSFKSTRPSDRIAQAYSRVRNREVFREDLSTMETIYESLSSGVLPYMVLSRQELLIQNHYRAIDDMVQAY